MKILEIDLGTLKKSDLEPGTFIFLKLLFEERKKEIMFLEMDLKTNLLYLQNLGYIKIIDEDEFDIEMRQKTIDLFSETINFDNFFFKFPQKTPDGRPLRSADKLWRGKLTKNYNVCRNKYLSAVKSQEDDELIIKILEAKAKKISTEKKNYENNIETYINKRQWEKDSIYLEDLPVAVTESNSNDINEMVQ